MIFSIIAWNYVANVLGLHVSHVYFELFIIGAGSTRSNLNIVHIFGYILVGWTKCKMCWSFSQDLKSVEHET